MEYCQSSFDNVKQMFTIYRLLGVSAVVHLIFIIMGYICDNYWNSIQYTDIDYKVFSDASLYVLNGQSPYRRTTYRYTPLLAHILVPNHCLFSDFGKVLFSFFDLFSGIIIYKIFKWKQYSNENATKYASLWILNPLVIVLSTRGSADTIVCFVLFLTYYYLLNRKYFLAGILFGFSIHFKLYPIIYSLLFFLFCYSDSGKRRSGIHSCFLFTGTTISTFVAITCVFYGIYGKQFIHETLLYHMSRVDIRHNYSIYFYPLYLLSSAGIQPGLWVWIPHLLLFPVVSFVFKRDICYGTFLLSFLFVAFNKVLTAQYFLWWLAPLVLIIPRCSLSTKQWLGVFSLLLLSQNCWNYAAYRLEFMGDSCFLQVWVACVLFFISEILFVLVISRHYKEYPEGIKNE